MMRYINSHYIPTSNRFSERMTSYRICRNTTQATPTAEFDRYLGALTRVHTCTALP